MTQENIGTNWTKDWSELPPPRLQVDCSGTASGGTDPGTPVSSRDTSDECNGPATIWIVADSCGAVATNTCYDKSNTSSIRSISREGNVFSAIGARGTITWQTTGGTLSPENGSSTTLTPPVGSCADLKVSFADSCGGSAEILVGVGVPQVWIVTSDCLSPDGWGDGCGACGCTWPDGAPAFPNTSGVCGAIFYYRYLWSLNGVCIGSGVGPSAYGWSSTYGYHQLNWNMSAKTMYRPGCA